MLKYNGDGHVVERKARLVAKGFTQIPGVDFFVTYASVVCHELLCMNPAIGIVCNYKIWQVNYASAYLNAPTQAPILMEQPEGYAKKPSNVFEVNIVVG